MATYKKKKAKKVVRTGIVTVNATFNNTIISFCDEQGGVVCWKPRFSWLQVPQSNSYAAQLAMERASEKAVKFGLKELKRVRDLALVVNQQSVR